MKSIYILAGFIGIAVNIWRNTRGTGGAPSPAALRQRDTALIRQRDGQEIFTRA